MSIELKIFSKSKETAEIQTLSAFQSWFDGYLKKDHLEYSISVYDYIQGDIMNWLNEHEGVKARNGITNGCYGARTGGTSQGLTVWVDAELLPDRWLDEEGDEIINIKALLTEYATELEDLDADSFLDACEALGHEIKGDNTYNYLEHDSDTPFPLQTVDFKCIQTEECEYGCKLVVVKFHFGGDPRGNYGSESVWKFNDPEDFYSVFMPSCFLKDDDVA